ncbi:MAG: hypothetical protein Alpg2KO_14100 [Alphaproteobacteria bacterium]
MAEVTRLAFVTNQKYIRRTLRRVGIRAYQPIEANAARALVAETDDKTIIAFPGTDVRCLRDWLRDFNGISTNWVKGGRVHRGFASGLRAMWPQLAQEIKRRGKPVVIAGHSLGGAYATLAHTLLPQAMTYSFGAPAVGDEDFGAIVNPDRLHRYVHCADMASSFTVKTRVTPYEHFGALKYIDRHGRIHDTISTDSMKADQQAAKDAYRAQKRVWFKDTRTRGLADHAPLNYSSALLGLRPEPPKADRRHLICPTEHLQRLSA